MIKALAVDLDDTIAMDNHEISKTDIKAIKELNNAGVKVIINSGRSEFGVKRCIEELGLMGHAHLAVNGAVILDYTKEVSSVVIKPFEKKVFNFLINKFRKEKIEFNVYRDGGLTYEFAPRLYEWNSGFHGKEYVTKGDVFKESDRCPRICVYYEDEEDVKYLRSICPKGYWSTANSHVLDYMPGGVNKWSGLEYVLNMYGIDKKDVWCMGDQESDIEMFKNCAKSFAVSNCDDLARKTADVILPRSNNENPASYLIYKYILKDEEKLKNIL